MQCDTCPTERHIPEHPRACPTSPERPEAVPAPASILSGPIWPKFELVRDVMHVLVTCKYKKDRIKNNREKVKTSFSPLQVNGGFLLPLKLEVLIQSALKP